MKYGIIDIGSNSVRLFITDENLNGKKYSRITQVASGLSTKGTLIQKSVDKTIKAVVEFVDFAKSEKVDKIYIYATEAIRSAPDGQTFCNLVTEKTAIPVQVLSGRQEAETGFFGAYGGQNTCVIDIGGGSTEIIVGDDKGITFSNSMPIGVVRLKDICGNQPDVLEGYINGFASCFTKPESVNTITAIGGTAQTAATIAQAKDAAKANIQDYVLTISKLDECIELVLNTPIDKRSSIPGLPQERANTILGGMMLLRAILKRLNADCVRVSCRDNMEGFLKMKLKRLL